ncbi:MAG: glutaredoxin 3 [Pseudomonadota bacterium]
MITIYTAMLCPYCARALQLLRSKNVAIEEIDVTYDPAERAQMRARAGGRNSVPQIWVGETHVGGSDELAALERAGELDPMIAAAAQ